ncbi:MAG: hypothetical protein HPY45_16145 [Anaerolineae bacterium]|nr:hypothetical protein [Anaerolineae bacterium]
MPDQSEDIWQQAVLRALPILEIFPENRFTDIDALLEWVLGEGQFGKNRWRLGTAKRLYYHLKPFIPQPLAWRIRSWYSKPERLDFPLQWPLEPRYPQFLWEVMRQVMLLISQVEMRFAYFWPEGKPFAFVLTHDIETAEGQKFVGRVADLEQSLGFRSSFNFIPERYPLDRGLIEELRQRGFEIGVHGLKHDGKLFFSQSQFEHRAARINQYLKQLKASGFRSPLTHRQPQWMQMLEIEYDLSFFDSDPYEPMPGGTMSIYPFFIGHFVELPYTLLQDYTLVSLLKQNSPQIWLDKVNFIEKYSGMALLNSHPDYLREERTWNIYKQFLTEMKQRNSYHALPREVSQWWRTRHKQESNPQTGKIAIVDNALQISPLS